MQTVILILRYLITAGGAFMVAHSKFVTGSDVEMMLGLVPTIAPIVLGQLTHLQQKAAIKEAAVTGVAAQVSTLSPLTASPAAAANAAKQGT